MNSTCFSVPLVAVNKNTDFCLFELWDSVCQEGYLVYYFLLVTLVVVIILMTQNSDTANASEQTLNSDTTNTHYDPNLELSRRLIRQVIHNQNNPNERLNYRSFPDDHGGHLTPELKTKLASILRTTYLANFYSFGTSEGIIYVRGTYRYPKVTPEMAGIVLSIESRP